MRREFDVMERGKKICLPTNPPDQIEMVMKARHEFPTCQLPENKDTFFKKTNR